MSRDLAIDVGGTFTDLCVREAGVTEAYKAATTPGDPTEGVLAAIEKAAMDRGESVAALLDGVDRLVHGTTIATNAIIEGETADTALLTTAGFPDMLLLREGGKEDPYDWSDDYPAPYVPRSLTFEVEERVNAEGGVETPLDDASAREAIAAVRDSPAESVAVCFLWSHVRPEHERRLGELLEEHAPELTYSLSHEVNPVTREYRRAIATAIDASLHSLVGDYLDRLEDRLDGAGYDGAPLIITANGGVMTLPEVERRPVWAVDSGPTMLPVAVEQVVGVELDETDAIALDMGGTSLDIGVVRDGRVPRTREAPVGDDILGVEKVLVESIGSGGGSVAWVDDGGLLRVGPESAGADPGPACYGRGGERPTVTDAALVLGYLNLEYFLGGNMQIDLAAAREALATLGDRLGLSPTEAAYAVYATATQDMVNGIRGLTVERGIDPAGYTLSGGGGALGVHVVPIARELGVDSVILPEQAGVVSALGGTVSQLRHDFTASHRTASDRFDTAGVNDTLDRLEHRGQAFLDRVGVPGEERQYSYGVEARYEEQVWQLQFELPDSRVDEDDVDDLTERFHATHEETYGFQAPDQAIEFLSWRVEVSGATEAELATAESTSTSVESTPHGEREAYFDRKRSACPAYRGDALRPGHDLSGPALVDARNTTVVLPPGSELTVTEYGNYRIEP